MNTSSKQTRPSTTKSTATEHITRTESDYTEQPNKSQRSNAPHRGILIRGCGPASGRPRRTPRAVDLDGTGRKIVSRWSGC